MTTTTNRLTVIALDIDGALSPINKADQLPNKAFNEWGGQENFTQATSSGSFGIWIANPLIEFLKDISGIRADVMWNTSWMEIAQEVIGNSFDLPYWEVLPTEAEHSNYNSWFKYQAVKRLLDEGRKVIWIDDDISKNLRKNSSMRLTVTSYELSSDLLIVSTDSEIGVDQRELNLINSKLYEWGF